MGIPVKDGGCGRPDCMATSSIAEMLSFGSGELDNYGFWEFPCEQCARAFEKLEPEYGPCWPPSKESK